MYVREKRLQKGIQVKSGLARESAIHGEATRTQRPVSWVLLKHGIGLASEWGEGGRVLWLTLAVSYFFMCRASELYATSNGTVHKEFCLTRKDVRHHRRYGVWRIE